MRENNHLQKKQRKGTQEKCLYVVLSGGKKPPDIVLRNILKKTFKKMKKLLKTP